jgi:hypothetical protein
MTKERVLIATTLDLMLTGVIVFAGDGFSRSNPTQKIGYSTDLKELRARFNTDKAKVRLLMLLSPT